MKATAKDLRFHSKELLDTVSRGEEVIITFRGKPYAKLVPFEPSIKNADGESKLFGIWKDHVKIQDVNQYIESIRRGRFEC